MLRQRFGRKRLPRPGEKRRIFRAFRQFPGQKQLPIARLLLGCFVVVHLGAIQLAQGHRHDLLGRQPLTAQLQQHGFLAPVEGLDQELLDNRPKIGAVAILGEDLVEGTPIVHGQIDLVTEAMIVQLDPDGLYPVQRLDFAPDTECHQKGEVGRAPVGWKPEPDFHPLIVDHLHTLDKPQLGEGLVKLGIGDPRQASPDFRLEISLGERRQHGLTPPRSALARRQVAASSMPRRCRTAAPRCGQGSSP